MRNGLKRHSENGFTLIELMIVVTIVGIMLSLAVPSFQRSIRRGHVDTATNSLLAGFATARAEAIRRGANNVKICVSADPSTNPVCGLPGAGVTRQGGWIVFIDADNNNVAAAAEVFKVGNPTDGVNILGTIAPIVTFNARGMVTAGAGSLTINAQSCSPGFDKQLTLTLGAVGRTQVNTVAQTCP